MPLPRIAILFGMLLTVRALPLAAQTDIIRGRIVGPDTLPVQNVTVTATSLGRANQGVSLSVKTKSDGSFTINFPGGAGDYLMTASAVGFNPAAPKELRRVAPDSALVFNVVLTKPRH